MAVGSGILSISPEKSEINKLVQQYNIGANFAKSDVQQVADFILKVKNTASLQQQFSTNAVAASANYTMDNADKYVDIYFKA